MHLDSLRESERPLPEALEGEALEGSVNANQWLRVPQPPEHSAIAPLSFQHGRPAAMAPNLYRPTIEWWGTQVYSIFHSVNPV